MIAAHVPHSSVSEPQPPKPDPCLLPPTSPVALPRAAALPPHSHRAFYSFSRSTWPYLDLLLCTIHQPPLHCRRHLPSPHHPPHKQV